MKKIEDRRYFVYSREILDSVLNFPSAEDRGSLIKLIFEYSKTGKEPKELPNIPGINILWTFIRKELDSSIAKFLNGSLGGAPKGNQNAKKQEDDLDFNAPKNNLKTT